MCCSAQTNPTWWDRAHAVYEKALSHGRPYAEKFAKQFPKRFESLKQTAMQEVKRAQKALDDSDLKQKQMFALELWRVRQSLDLATLLSPPVLKEMTGLDVPTVNDLKSRVVKLEKSLEAQIAELVHR